MIIFVTFAIYVRAGKEIFKKRQELRSFTQAPTFTVIENPFISCKTTEVEISSEPAAVVRNDSQTSLCDDHGNRMHGYNPYSVSVEIGSAASESIPPRTAGYGRPAHRNKVSNEATSAAWGYTKCALLFFISLIITWVSQIPRSHKVSSAKLLRCRCRQRSTAFTVLYTRRRSASPSTTHLASFFHFKDSGTRLFIS